MQVQHLNNDATHLPHILKREFLVEDSRATAL